MTDYWKYCINLDYTTGVPPYSFSKIEDATRWCKDNLAYTDYYYRINMFGATTKFYFSDKNDAILFKLTWT